MTEERKDGVARLVEAYGSDPSRWPEAERRAFDRADPAALGEAREIDAVLAHASLAEIAGPDRARMLARLGAIAAMPQARPVGNPRARIPGRPVWSGWAPVATALAASLALGIYLGSAGLVDELLPATSDSLDTAMLQGDVDVTGTGDLADLIDGGSS